jgi:hypothetical protein
MLQDILKAAKASFGAGASLSLCGSAPLVTS